MRARHGRRKCPKDIREPQNSARYERGGNVYEIFGIIRELSKRPKRQRIAIQKEDRQVETSERVIQRLGLHNEQQFQDMLLQMPNARLQGYLASLLRLDSIKDKALTGLKERVQWILQKHRLDAVPLPYEEKKQIERRDVIDWTEVASATKLEITSIIRRCRYGITYTK
ncbi:hypothetical protein RFI_39262, partial [Reticulomyxa filosa]